MTRVAIAPQEMVDGGLFGPTFTTVDGTNFHTVPAEPGIELLFRNPNLATRTVTFKRHVRGVELTHVCTIPAASGATSGIGVMKDLDPKVWGLHSGTTDVGKLYFDPSASDFAVAAIRRRPGT